MRLCRHPYAYMLWVGIKSCYGVVRGCSTVRDWTACVRTIVRGREKKTEGFWWAFYVIVACTVRHKQSTPSPRCTSKTTTASARLCTLALSTFAPVRNAVTATLLLVTMPTTRCVRVFDEKSILYAYGIVLYVCIICDWLQGFMNLILVFVWCICTLHL